MFIRTFFKVFRWIICISALIGGIAALNASAVTASVKPIGIMIPCFAVVFWMSKLTYEASKPVFYTGLAIIFISWALSHFVVNYITYYYMNMGYFMSWEVTMLAIGIPVMGYTFWKNAD